MPLSLPESPGDFPTPESLHAALCRWHEAVLALCILARTQLSCIEDGTAEAIGTPGLAGADGFGDTAGLAQTAETSPMAAILSRKETAFRTAVELSQSAAVLQTGLESRGRTGREPAIWSLIEIKRAEISRDLTALADLEDRSETQLLARLHALRSELDHLRRGRGMTCAYTPSVALPPRFLDQRR